MHEARATLRRLPRAVRERLSRIELMVFDVDGVLTDGRLWFGVDGEMLKAFHALDGQGLKSLAEAGIAAAVISGRDSPITLRRCAELGIEHVAQGIADKGAAFDALRHELGKTADVCGFMGDDVIDLPVLRRAGFAATVPNAADGVAAYAHWTSRRAGGEGAVREVCDLLVAARETLSMRERGTLLLSVVLLGGLAAGSYWLAEQARLGDAPTRKLGHDIDYTADDITLTRMDETGRAQYVVDATKLVHYFDDDTGELTLPHLVGSKVDRPEMRLRADRGVASDDNQEVRLYGNVVMNRQPWRNAAAMVAKGPYMLVYPEREVLSTDQPVEIVQGGSTMEANAMHYDNGTRRVSFGSGSGRIHNVIEPRGGRAAKQAATQASTQATPAKGLP